MNAHVPSTRKGEEVGAASPSAFVMNRLGSRLGELREQFRNAQPYPFIVIDDFLPEAILNSVLEEFPAVDDPMWHRFNAHTEIKLGSTREALLPPTARHVLQELNSGAFLEFMEALTGIDNLIADTKLSGGGLHQIQRGGKLAIHADFAKNPMNHLDRRLNLLLYLNKDWKEEYGGHFEIWDPEMKGCKHRILPIFNRCVVIPTTSWTYHGHPDPLTCPENRTRKSMALYYYTNGRPEGELVADAHPTLFRTRPGEKIEGETRRRLKAVAQDWLPPVAYRFAKRVLGRG